MNDPRYPIGPRLDRAPLSADERSLAIERIAQLPEEIREAVRGLSEDQLNTPYREGGWTLRQVVHHVADSHMVGLARMRKALTEDWPTVFVYSEPAWAQLADYHAPVEWSLDLLDGLHARWTQMLTHVPEAAWLTRGILHPERGRLTLDALLATYEWHSLHHVAHITHLRAARRW